MPPEPEPEPWDPSVDDTDGGASDENELLEQENGTPSHCRRSHPVTLSLCWVFKVRSAARLAASARASARALCRLSHPHGSTRLVTVSAPHPGTAFFMEASYNSQTNAAPPAGYAAGAGNPYFPWTMGSIMYNNSNWRDWYPYHTSYG